MTKLVCKSCEHYEEKAVSVINLRCSRCQGLALEVIEEINVRKASC